MYLDGRIRGLIFMMRELESGHLSVSNPIQFFLSLHRTALPSESVHVEWCRHATSGGDALWGDN